MMTSDDFRTSRYWRATTSRVLALSLLLPWTAFAQDSAAVPADPESLLREAHAKTKSVKTHAECAEILRLCEQAGKAPLSDRWRKYADELVGWTHNRCGELYADQAAALADQGQARQAEQVDTKALEEFEQAVALNPGYWKAVHNRGVSYAVAHRFDEAIADFTRVTELKPDYANAWFNRGEIYFEQEDYESAVADYDQMIRLKPDDYEARLQRGHAYFHLRRFSEAQTDYTRAAGLAPTKAEPLVHRGDAHLNLGQWQQAADDYRQAVMLDARFGHAYQSAAWLMATCPEERYRKAELAVQAAEKAIELDGADNFKYLDTLAAAQANAGDFEKAVATMAEALKIAPVGHADALRKRLALYQKREAYRQPPVTAAAESGA
jgi:tetratricopeptide (TPR) repeat protein